MTASERRLWDLLRKLNLNIRRQSPIARYIADFVQHEARLIIEVDGGPHVWHDAQRRDAARDAWLTDEGYRVIRIADRLVFETPNEVAAMIAVEIESRRGSQRRSHPHPCPSPIKGEGVKESS